jgi:hypothetical protein
MTRPDHDLVAEDYIPSSSELARDQVALYEARTGEYHALTVGGITPEPWAERPERAVTRRETPSAPRL